MRTHSWLALPLLTALLACKGGATRSEDRAQPESEGASSRTQPEPAATRPTAGSAEQSESATRAATAAVPQGGDASTTGTLALTIIEGRAGVEDTGFLHIVGEIRNDSSRWIERPVVDVRLLDAQGKPIGVDSIAAAEGFGETALGERTSVPPGEVSPFHYIRDVKKLASPYGSHKLSARAWPGDGKTHATVQDVKLDKEMVGKIEYWRLTGTVKNTGRACRLPTAVIALYDAAGKAYQVREGLTEWELRNDFPVDGTVAFRAGPFDTKGTVKSYKVWGECEPD